MDAEQALRDLIDAVAERAHARGAQERAWLANWRSDYTSAVDDDEARALLLDTLVAFDAWLGSRHPTRLRPVA